MDVLNSIERESGPAFFERTQGSRPSLPESLAYFTPGSIHQVTLGQHRPPEVPYLPLLANLLRNPGSGAHALLIDLSHRFDLDDAAEWLGPHADLTRLHLLPAFDARQFKHLPTAIDHCLARNRSISLVIVNSLDTMFPILRLNAPPPFYYEVFVRQWRKDRLAPVTVDKYPAVAVLLYTVDLFGAKK